jgi:hypothetical protein
LCGTGVTSSITAILMPSAFSARTADSRPGRALDAHFQVLDALVLRNAAGVLGSNLGSERGRLARTLEALATGGRPRQGVALTVGDGDDGVVERSVDVRDAVGNVLLDLLTRALGGVVRTFAIRFFLCLRLYFFSATPALRGPLRVRALVRVR